MQGNILPSVQEITYDGNNAAFFITLLEATLKTIGEGCNKARLIALSGEGNRFCWTDGLWVFGNETTDSINETPFETERRVLSAIGWKAEYITVQYGKDGGFLNTNALQIRRDFISAIDKGLPVLIRYVQHDDCDLNVFIGYDDGGKKIIGYDYNKGFEAGAANPNSASVLWAWDNWEKNIAGYILLQEKTSSVTEREIALSTFRFISDHARKTNEIRGRIVGHAAWKSFLRQLEYDDFSDLSFEDVKNRFFIYCDALCQIDARRNALPYYHYLAQCFPEWQDRLNIAIQALDECASYGGYLWGCGFTFDEAGIERFRLQQERKILADAGQEAMYKDMLAVEQFESILSQQNIL